VYQSKTAKPRASKEKKYRKAASLLMSTTIGLMALPVVANTEMKKSETIIPSFMVGRWRVDTKNGTIEESWLPALHGNLFGIRRTVKVSAHSTKNKPDIKMIYRFLTLIPQDKNTILYVQDTGPRLHSKRKLLTGSVTESSVNHLVIDFKRNSQALKSVRYVRTFDDNLLVIYEYSKSRTEKRWYLTNVNH